jgi:hypothetical protein
VVLDIKAVIWFDAMFPEVLNVKKKSIKIAQKLLYFGLEI